MANHPKEEIAKFGYRWSERKVESFFLSPFFFPKKSQNHLYE
jgi:hypothetical protein